MLNMEKSFKIEELLNRLPPEFTSVEARSVLSPSYKAPNKLLEELVNKGQLIRLKKGLFTLASGYEPLAAAGTIHGPSYLSFETALGFYELIPERVHAVMSVVDNRQLRIEAGGHLFIYRSQARDLFAAGMTAVNLNGRNVLIATREKAVLDTVAWYGVNTRHITQSQLFGEICSSYRLDTEDLLKLSRKYLNALAPMYRSRAPRMFVDELTKRKIARK